MRWPSTTKIVSAIVWTRGKAKVHYATPVRICGWLLAAWEVFRDRFHNPSVLTAAAGMILIKTVKRGSGGGDNGDEAS